MTKQKAYTDKELKNLSPTEANSKLDEEQFKRYQKIQKEKLKEQYDKNMMNKQEERDTVINRLIESSKNKMTKKIEVYGEQIKVKIDMDRKQRKILREIKKEGLEDKDLEDISEDKIDKLREKMIDLISQSTPDIKKSEWEKLADEVSIFNLNQIAGQIYEFVQKEIEKKTQK